MFTESAKRTERANIQESTILRERAIFGRVPRLERAILSEGATSRERQPSMRRAPH